MFREPDASVLAGLCVGTSKIAVIVAERDPNSSEMVHIIGISSAQSQGIRKGLIVNLEQAEQSVRNAVKDAENIVGFRLEQAMVSFNALDVMSVITEGMVSLGRVPRPVQVDDVERVIEAAQSQLSIPPNKLPLHTIPVRYSLDGNSGIDDPMGMAGMRLDIELQTVTVPMPYVHNVVNCVEASGLEVEGLVIKPLSSALGALTDEEMRVGAISLSIGGGVTGLTFYRDGRPMKVAIIPIGGDHITSDLAHILQLPLNKAENLKKRLFSIEDGELITLGSKGQQGRTIDPNKACEVIRYRLEELFADYMAALIPERDPRIFPAGIIVSGGVAKTPGLETLLSDIFRMPVRLADPREQCQMPPGREDVSFVNALGTIRYILSKERSPYRFIDPPRLQWRPGHVRLPGPKTDPNQFRLGKRVQNMVEKVKESLKELF
ncbi:MAG: cell division protein FtsA [Synergistaceae bacterium]|nr:cell division protein FtsA [Synergistaceae bacterium]